MKLFANFTLRTIKKLSFESLYIYIHSILCDFMVTSAAALSLGFSRNAARKLLHM